MSKATVLRFRIDAFLKEIRHWVPDGWKYEVRLWNPETNEEFRVNPQGAYEHAPPDPIPVKLIDVTTITDKETDNASR